MSLKTIAYYEKKKVEVKPSAVNATCHADTKIPGIKFWEELTTTFRR